MINETDVNLGTIDARVFYTSKYQFKYWKHTHLTIEITKFRVSSFSLEIPLGMRSIIKSRFLTG